MAKTAKNKSQVSNKANESISAHVPLQARKISLNYLLAGLVAFVGFLLYANTFQHGYALDDSAAIIKNQFVQQGFAGIPSLFKVDFWHFSKLPLGYYRPMALVTFAMEHQFFGSSPHISHVINGLLYAFTGFMLVLCLQELFSQYKTIIPFLVALIFIAHPIHTEVVANVKSRDEILSFLGIISCLFLMLRHEHEKGYKYIILSLIIYYFSFLSKETSITFLAILPASFYFFRERTIAQCIMKTLPFLAVMILFYFQKKQVLGEIPDYAFLEINNYPYTGNEFASSMVVFLVGLKLLFIPYILRYDYSYNAIPISTFSDPLAIMGLIVFIALIGLSSIGFLKRQDWSYGLIFLLVSFIPGLAFIWLRGGIFAERFLYYSVLGMSILFVFGIAKLFKLELKHAEENNSTWSFKHLFQEMVQYKILTASAIIIFLAFSFKTIARNPAWKDNATLFATDIGHNPNSAQNNKHHANEMLESAMKLKDTVKRNLIFDEALVYYKKALEINPRFGEVYGDLGRGYSEIRNNLDSSIFFYKACLQATPGAAISTSNLGLIYQRMGRYKLASFYFNRAKDINPNFRPNLEYLENLKRATGLDVHQFPVEEEPLPAFLQQNNMRLR